MAGLYSRVAARGFPSSLAAGVTGEGALESQGGTVDPAHGQNVAGTQAQTLPGQSPEGPPAPAVEILEGTWGLPGAPVLGDQTPRTHAAPVPGWAGSYADPELLTVHDNSAVIHAADFGALTRHVHVEGEEREGAKPSWDKWSSNNAGEVVLEPVTGQLQAMGGRDRTQGYNLSNRYGFDAGHRERIVDQTPQPMSYLDPAERPFVVPQASGGYTPTDAVQGPDGWTAGWDAGAINPDPPSAYEPPPQPDSLQTPLASAPVSSGWW